MSEPPRKVGIIGGSGISDLFERGERSLHRVHTPWGAPSGPVEAGRIAGVEVLFLLRHGPGHTIPPHRVNYRANLAALESLGADTVVTLSSVGSLREELPPGTFVLPDQFVDMTKLRATTYFDGGRVYHVSLADPFCPRLRRACVEAGAAVGTPFYEPATYVCVEGPRFSTRAESRFFRTFADVIGMTLVPEVTLAREKGLCYACLAMVTDFDVWAQRPVDAHEIVATMASNSERMRRVVTTLLPKLSGPRDCACAHSLDQAGI